MKSIADINAIRDKMKAEIALRKNIDSNETRIIVKMGECGIKAGAKEVFNTLVDEVVEKGLYNVHVTRLGCAGDCKNEPIVEVIVPNENKVTYGKIDVVKAKKIIENHIVGGNVCKEYIIDSKE